MCRVKPLAEGEKVLGSIVEPCADAGILCIKVIDDKDKLVDNVFLRFRNEETTVNTDTQLVSSNAELFVSDHFEIKDVPVGKYNIILEKKDGMEFMASRSHLKFEIAAGRFTLIELVYVPETQIPIQDLIQDRILENRELMSQMEADIPEDATLMYCSDCCIDFPTLLAQLNSQTAMENSQITLLGVHDPLPFSIFNEVRKAFDVVDYSRTALRLGVSAGNTGAFLEAMHKNKEKVVFLVPPKPREKSHTRTSKEFIWYNANPLCKEHVTFVFGSYNVVSTENIELYLNGDDQTMRKKQLLTQYSEFLKPQIPCLDSTSERFRLAKDEHESGKQKFSFTADDAEGDIDLDSL